MSNSFYLLENHQALGTTWYIELFGVSSGFDCDNIQERLVSEIDTFQKKYSRFIEDSLLNILNREYKITFDQDLFTMLEVAEKWRIDTDGIFDIAIKKKLEKIGYGHTQETEEKEDVFEEEESGISRVKKVDGCVVWNSKKQIDLGGIGKGFLIDKLSDILQNEYGVRYFLINGGGDIYGTSNQEESIELLLEHPTDIDTYIGKVYIKNSSLCVSSSFKRVWVKDGTRYNHLIDTKKGDVVESASYVLSSTATKADILATILALLANSQDSVNELASNHQAEYMTLNAQGEIYCSSIFKNALEAL